MRKVAIIAIALFVASIVAIAFAGTEGKMSLKVGDEVYACNCGEKCPCQSMANKPGKCTCGTDMVKAKVMKIEGDTAYLKAEGWEKERPFNTVGKYTCACGAGCDCNMISQNPGKCTCGTEMKKVGG
ncbi:MAG TPA: hypothetical protein VLD40_01535 [Dissulfurispiraceae bacterium]|nr:hypothetical protein [Dissulfurispiraceae bacterium]